MMKKILVPISFSEYSHCGISSAASLAKKSKGELILVHVSKRGEKEEEVNEKIETLKDSDILQGIDYTFKSTDGKVVQSIVKEDADIIVIGDREAHGVAGFFKGTIAEKVAKSSRIPVITVKHHTDLSDIQSIVYPTDMRIEQEKVVKDIKELQAFYGAHLHLVKVYSDITVKQKDVEKRLKGFAEFNGFTNYSITARDNMDEGAEIMQFAEELGADMIAMATHDRHGLERLIGGYISGEILRASKTAIWTKALEY